MIQISEYDFTQPSMRKAWKAEFRQYLIEYYKPSLVNADKIFNAITLVDSFVKKHTAIERKLLSLVSENDVVDIRTKMLSHQPFAMGAFHFC